MLSVVSSTAILCKYRWVFNILTSIPLSNHSVVDMLGHTMLLFPSSGRICILLPIMMILKSHYHWQSMKGLPSLNLPCFVFLYFWYLLSSVRWYLLVILIYTSLRITDIEHLSHINASNLYILFWKGLLEPVTYTFFF